MRGFPGACLPLRAELSVSICLACVNVMYVYLRYNNIMVNWHSLPPHSYLSTEEMGPRHSKRHLNPLVCASDPREAG
jgi:hypothetical protein